jgi:hypothetical protein
MSSRLIEIFEDEKLINRIKTRLPYLFKTCGIRKLKGVEDWNGSFEPISTKTITVRGFGGVKLIWTVDAQKAREFRETYYPHCDILLIQINWAGTGIALL